MNEFLSCGGLGASITAAKDLKCGPSKHTGLVEADHTHALVTGGDESIADDA